MRSDPSASCPVSDVPALVFCGGRGTRLWPVTHDRVPKPLVAVGGRPLIEHTIAHLVQHGVTRLTLIVWHLADQIRGFCSDGRRFGASIEYCEAGAGSFVGLLQRVLSVRPIDGDFIVCCADEIREGLDLRQAYEFHRRTNAMLTLTVTPLDEPRGQYAVAELGRNGRVCGMRRARPWGSPGMELAYLGLSIAGARLRPLLARLPEGCGDRRFVRELIRFGGLCAFIQPYTQYLHVAEPEDLRRAEQRLRRETVCEGAALWL